MQSPSFLDESTIDGLAYAMSDARMTQGLGQVIGYMDRTGQHVPSAYASVIRAYCRAIDPAGVSSAFEQGRYKGLPCRPLD